MMCPKSWNWAVNVHIYSQNLTIFFPFYSSFSFSSANTHFWGPGAGARCPAMLPRGGRGHKHTDRSLHPGLCSQRARVRRPQASVKQNKNRFWGRRQKYYLVMSFFFKTSVKNASYISAIAETHFPRGSSGERQEKKWRNKAGFLLSVKSTVTEKPFACFWFFFSPLPLRKIIFIRE